jgi:hypothetical protein
LQKVYVTIIDRHKNSEKNLLTAEKNKIQIVINEKQDKTENKKIAEPDNKKNNSSTNNHDNSTEDENSVTKNTVQDDFFESEEFIVTKINPLNKFCYWHYCFGRKLYLDQVDFSFRRKSDF